MNSAKVGERFIKNLKNIPLNIDSILSSRRAPVDTPDYRVKNLFLRITISINLNV